MRSSVTISEQRWEASLAALSKEMADRLTAIREKTSAALRQSAAVIAMELADRTFPSVGAIGLAVNAMRFDLRRVYITAGGAYEQIQNTAGKAAASAFYAAWQNRRFSQAATILRSSGAPIAAATIGQPLDPAIRESRRDKNGRVVSANALQIVTKEELAAFEKVAIREIGKTSAGWNACAEKLGADGNAVKWKGTAVHGSDGGSVSLTASEMSMTITLVNHMPLARKHISPGQLGAILERGKQIFTTALNNPGT